VLLASLLLFANPAHAIFGTELGPLLKLVAGQLEEIRQLTEAVGVAKDQVAILRQINDGIGRVTNTIHAIEEISRRAKGLDPKSVKRLADLTRVVQEVGEIRRQTQVLLLLKTQIADEAIMQAGLQSETAYLMGQEMIGTGGQLTREAALASPGRASQISAASGANSMLAQGVQLQTLAQIAQMQAVSLELQKSLIERDAQLERERTALFHQSLAQQAGMPSKAPKNRRAAL
jgi:hypothetical protein